eukprot:13673587-Alexandrium_andersonii.AAC.1
MPGDAAKKVAAIMIQARPFSTSQRSPPPPLAGGLGPLTKCPSHQKSSVASTRLRSGPVAQTESY